MFDLFSFLPSYPLTEIICLIGFQKNSYSAIERLTIESRKTRTKLITLANHSMSQQRQSDHEVNTCKQVTKLTSREKSASCNFKLVAAYGEKPKLMRINCNTQVKTLIMLTRRTSIHINN